MKTNEDNNKEQELSEARSLKSSYESRRAYKQSVCNANNAKIERLKTVKTNLEIQKSNAKGRYSSLKKYSEDTDNFSDWYGNMCDTTMNNLTDIIVPEYKNYVNRIDEVLDAVCDEITRLQNENMQLNGDILWLTSAINSLINEIRTLCN